MVSFKKSKVAIVALNAQIDFKSLGAFCSFCLALTTGVRFNFQYNFSIKEMAYEYVYSCDTVWCGRHTAGIQKKCSQNIILLDERVRG